MDLMKDDMFRWIGGILIGLGIFCTMVGVFGTISPPEGNTSQDYLIIIGFCTSTLLIPGIVIFAWGWKLGKEESELEKLAGYLKSYRRIKTSDVAKKLGKTEYETEQLITKCVKQGLITGYFDRSSGEFFTYESLFEEVKRPDKCPNCGASLYTRLLSGESAVCNYCGATFTPPPIERSPPPPPPIPYYPQQQYPPPPQHYQPPQPYPPKVQPQAKTFPNLMNVKCPGCAKVFDVQQQARPFRIKCPYCGTEGMMA